MNANNALGITNERECEMLKKVDEIVNTGDIRKISDLILDIESVESFNRIEKTYAVFLLGKTVERRNIESYYEQRLAKLEDSIIQIKEKMKI